MKFSTSLLAAVLILGGCKSYEGDFVPKTEAQLEAMEKENQKAHDLFVAQNYPAAAAILQELTKERTVSLPQYELEQVSLLLMQGKKKEAHELMMRIQNDFETLFDTALEEKATSLWHGEQNKVFKGDPHERSTLYAFLAMSFMGRGEYEDALRCVRNGLLADADVAEAKYASDYALLQYLGAFCSAKLNQPEDAAAYRKEMWNSLSQRELPLAPEVPPAETCFAALDADSPNVLLVLWVGRPPSFERGGEYGEIRHPIPGHYPYDALTLAIASEGGRVLPSKLGDISFQATTRGGRLMDTVLSDKATAKKVAEMSRNLFLIAGTGLVVAGGSSMSSPVVGVSLLGAGVGCLVVGGTIHVVGAIMNPNADIRHWRNLPCELVVIPLRLPAGRNDLFVTGYLKSDVTEHAAFAIDVDAERSLNIVHLPLMGRRENGEALIADIHKQFRVWAVERANSHPLSREVPAQ